MAFDFMKKVERINLVNIGEQIYILQHTYVLLHLINKILVINAWKCLLEVIASKGWTVFTFLTLKRLDLNK